LHAVEPLVDRVHVIDEYFSRLLYGVIHLDNLSERISPAGVSRHRVPTEAMPAHWEHFWNAAEFYDTEPRE
jgi:hypothetical protein